MTRKKFTSADSAGNGSEPPAAASASVQASADELERLRDILIGSHVRGAEQRVGELQAQLIALRDEFESRLNELGANLADGLQETQQSAQRRDQEVDGELRQLRQLLDIEKDMRFSVGQMLVELGQRLQDVDPGLDEA
jgi:hypothetical protein